MFTKHAEEIAKYIESKFPDIPVYVAQDVSVFAANRAAVMWNDMLNDYIRQERKRYGPVIKMTREEEED